MRYDAAEVTYQYEVPNVQSSLCVWEGTVSDEIKKELPVESQKAELGIDDLSQVTGGTKGGAIDPGDTDLAKATAAAVIVAATDWQSENKR